MKEWIGVRGGGVILKGLGVLPRPMARKPCRGSNAHFLCLLPGLRRTAEVNLRIAFPDWTTRSARQSFAGCCGIWLGCAEFARFFRIFKRNIEQMSCWTAMKTSWRGSGAGKAALSDGAHRCVGVGRLLPCTLRISPALHGPRIDNWENSTRFVNSYRCCGESPDFQKMNRARVMLKVLQRPGTIGILADQNTMPGEAVFRRFFWEEGQHDHGNARVALHTDAAVVPGYRSLGRSLAENTGCA